MSVSNSGTGWNLRAIWALPNDDMRKIIAVALVVCAFCAALVSVSVVSLRPVQRHNAEAFRARNIVEVAGVWLPGEDPVAALKKLELRWVEPGSGREIADPGLPADPQRLSKDPQWSMPLARQEDPASVKRLPKALPVYLKTDEQGQVQTVVLPVFGAGLWGMMWGFIAIDGDGNTVKNLKFYQQSETPGLGAEVENPKWRALWHGKRVFDEQGQLRIAVIKGRVPVNSPDAAYQVDGLAGATLTSKGVDQMIRFWLGPRGFGPYLAQLREQRHGQ